MLSYNPLRQIQQPIQNELAEVEKNLRESIDSIKNEHTRTNDFSRSADRAVAHLFSARGKRLRPTLLLLAAKSTGRKAPHREEAVVQLATAVEIVHSASLVHDDIVDGAAVRRKRKSLNAAYGNRIAVLSGDILYAEFFSLLQELDGVDAETRLEFLSMFTRVTRNMCFGEISEEQIRESGAVPSFEDYLDTIENKTAILTAACCQAGAMISDADRKSTAALRTYGHAVGMAYQLLDDIADGDSVRGADEVRIQREAEHYLSRARDALQELPQNAATTRLEELVSYLNHKDPVHAG